MSKISPQELDRQIQLALVAKIRQAAHLYKGAHSEPGSPALQAYVAALECLAEHIASKCRESRPTTEIAVPLRFLHGKRHLSAVAKLRTESRVIPFPSANGGGPSPLNAA
jgi:hypothetical protein